MPSTRYLKRLRHAAFVRQERRCFWCSEEIYESVEETHPRRCTADHVRPVSRGGRTHPENIVAACYQCNHTRPGWEFSPAGYSAARKREVKTSGTYSHGPGKYQPTLGDIMREAGIGIVL